MLVIIVLFYIIVKRELRAIWGRGFPAFFKPENPVFTYKVKEKSEVIEYLLEKTGLTKK